MRNTNLRLLEDELADLRQLIYASQKEERDLRSEYYNAVDRGAPQAHAEVRYAMWQAERSELLSLKAKFAQTDRRYRAAIAAVNSFPK